VWERGEEITLQEWEAVKVFYLKRKGRVIRKSINERK